MKCRVDAEDYPKLSEYNWHAIKHSKDLEGRYIVARRNSPKGGVYMHVQIMGKRKGFIIDHINRNSLDNRKSNLRFITLSQNQHNKSKSKSKTSSKFKGVHWDSSRKLWKAAIVFQGRNIFIGRFKTEKDAARAYDAKSKEIFKDFGHRNF
jgi:hypothetical protein